ncbi:tail fiber protein [Klebsiella phage VLCpiD7b]|nr:tail fiber protein [Klebsiella phage VLCpiD7b]
MALYREGKAAMAADGTVTGTGTKWQSSLSLIRPGATIMFLSSPIQMAVVNKVVSDTEIKAITTKGAVVASTDYAILLSDSLTVDGLAQDVAETLRYYQSQETVIAEAVEFFKDFDFEALQNLANQVKADSEAAESSALAAATSESKAKDSETKAKASENAAKTSEVAAETARDQVQQIINDAGDQSTLVVLAQPNGFSKVGKFASVNQMRSQFIGTVNGESVLLDSYHPGSNAGGGEFYFDASDLTSADDGVFTFVTVSGARLKRKGLDGVITLSQAGAPIDGTTNSDDAFSRLHAAIAARPEVWKVDGEGITYKRTTPLQHDISKYSINNMYLDYSAATDYSATTPFYAYMPTDSVGSSDRRNTRSMSNVIFKGPAYRTSDNIHGLRLHMDGESETLRQTVLDNVVVRDFNKGVVFGSHAYLITFRNCELWRCFAGFSDIEKVEGITFTDAGENIRFFSGLFNSLHQCFDFGTKELNINFYGTSFDYTGRTAAEAYDQFVFGDGATHQINLTECFFESGNANAGWFGKGFKANGAVTIRIVGGVIRLNQNNQCSHFFYDESGLASFSIDGATINGWGVQQWANRGLTKFRPQLKGDTSQFTLKTTDDPIVNNVKFVNGLDYQARGLNTSTYTDKATNDRIKIEQSTITKEDGTVIPSLKITKLAGYGQFADAIIKFKRPVRAQHNASIHGNIKFVAGPNMSSARVITAITGSMTPGFTNNQGVDLGFRSTTTTSNSLSLLDQEAWYSINTSWGANKSNSYLEFEYDNVRLDLTNLALNDVIHVFNLEWHGAF